jgi:hypothetical protein
MGCVQSSLRTFLLVVDLNGVAVAAHGLATLLTKDVAPGMRGLVVHPRSGVPHQKYFRPNSREGPLVDVFIPRSTSASNITQSNRTN